MSWSRPNLLNKVCVDDNPAHPALYHYKPLQCFGTFSIRGVITQTRHPGSYLIYSTCSNTPTPVHLFAFLKTQYITFFGLTAYKAVILLL